VIKAAIAISSNIFLFYVAQYSKSKMVYSAIFRAVWTALVLSQSRLFSSLL